MTEPDSDDDLKPAGLTESWSLALVGPALVCVLAGCIVFGLAVRLGEPLWDGASSRGYSGPPGPGFIAVIGLFVGGAAIGALLSRSKPSSLFWFNAGVALAGSVALALVVLGLELHAGTEALSVGLAFEVVVWAMNWAVPLWVMQCGGVIIGYAVRWVLLRDRRPNDEFDS